MRQQPLLSIILTFRNQRDVIEPTLSALYGMESVPFELFVIEDASADGSSDAIRSLLDYYEHEQTYYFEHTEPFGRGSCLNEALQQCNGAVIWTPRSVGHIEESLLKDVALHLRGSEFSFFCNVASLPLSSTAEWIDFIRGDNWPIGGDFLWNLNRIPSGQRFFSPYSDSYHALELAVRLGASATAGQIEPWHRPVEHVPVPKITPEARAELAYTLLRRQNLTAEQHESILGFLNKPDKSEPVQAPVSEADKILAEAKQMKQDGRFNSALELVEQLLTKQPGHQQARELKIVILERKRRFVEASELKHEMNASKKSGGEEPSANEIKTSIIIPTAIYGKPALEHCLVSVAEYCNSETTELIVIDNASLDDTHDYLEELQSKHFFHCKVITNKQNAGFSASVNQGLEKAIGQYACIMHNDVELTNDAIHQLEQVMDAHPGFALAGPLAGKTLNPDQSVNKHESQSSQLLETEYPDSFCMMIRMDTNLRMDESYQLAFFEDIDLCFQARDQGYKVGVASGITVEHHFGTTTFALNLDTESEEYWKNVSYFNKKWDVEVYSEEELKSRSRFGQLLALNDIVNPIYPEDSIRVRFNQLFTDEVKTEILKSDHDPDTLCQLVRLMMVMEQREVMRRLEDKLDDVELPASLIYQLVRFYFNRNIYSRCIHYLDKLKSGQQTLQSELYRLEILVNQKELETAVSKLKKLLEAAPSNPTLYKLAGDIHQFEGNDEEAASFYQIAYQINPFEYSPEGKEELRLNQ